MKKQILIISLTLLQISIFAQTNYVHYTVKDGLPQMQCMNLFQDSKGYIWIGTKGGLSRYDGISFKNYSLNDGFPENLILKVKEDSEGNIWVLTSSGLSVLKNEQFVFFQPEKELFFRTHDLIIDSVQNIWLIEGFNLNKLIKFSNGKYKNIFSVKEKYISSLSNLSYDKQNDEIFFTGNKKNGSQLYSVKKNILKSKEYKNSYFYLYHNEKLALEVKQGNHILYKLNNNDTIKLYQSDEVINKPKRINDSTIVFTNSNFQENMPVNYLINGKLQKKTSSFDQINDILQDSEKNIWIASEKGLYKLTAFNNFTEKDNMLNYVWSIQEDINGKIWFSSYGSYFMYFMKNDKIYKYKKRFKYGNFFFGAIKTKKGNLLFPYAGGISVYNGVSFSELKFPYPDADASLSIYEDTETSKLYFGNFAGLIIKDNKENFEINKRFVKGKDDIVLAMTKNKKSELWFVSRKTFGVLNRPDTLIMHNDTINGAMCLYCDYKDNLWIGTDNGLFLYNYKNFTRIYHPELQTMIGSIVQTDSTHFVYGGLRGIGIFDLKKFYSNYETTDDLSKIDAEYFVDYYTQSHGFFGEEIGQAGIFKDSKGRVWVPTNNNVVMFNPKNLKENLKPPYTHITNFQTSEDNTNWINEADSIHKITYKKSNVRIDFIGISHTAPDMVKYKFRLKGFNNTWSNETKERYVTYTNLPSGRYSFELLAKNNNNIWNLKPVIRNFEIIPAWWQTIWFNLGFLIFAIISIFLIIRIFYRKKVKKAKLTERLNKLQLQSKQSQLYPHLLFNTATAAGSVIYKENKEKAYDFVVKLSQFMRHALEDTKRLYKNLQDEIDFVDAYLQLQKIRFSERFDYKINIGKNVNLSMQVPQMIIQTYVENAVKYGLEPLKEGGFLEIRITKEVNCVKIIVKDNGIGIEQAKKLSGKGTGSGINIMNEIYEIHNKSNKNKIYFKLIDLYELGNKGTQSVIEITT